MRHQTALVFVWLCFLASAQTTTTTSVTTTSATISPAAPRSTSVPLTTPSLFPAVTPTLASTVSSPTTTTSLTSPSVANTPISTTTSSTTSTLNPVTSGIPIGGWINCLDSLNFARPECQCQLYFSRTLSTGLCELNCSAVPYNQGTQTSTSCFCQAGYFWNRTANACYRNCSNIPHTSGNNPANPTLCQCLRPFIPDGNTCRLDCKSVAYSNGQTKKNGQCKCNDDYRWDNIIKACLSSKSNTGMKLGVGLGVGLGGFFLLAALAAVLGLLLCRPNVTPAPRPIPPTPPLPMMTPYPQNYYSVPPPQFMTGSVSSIPPPGVAPRVVTPVSSFNGVPVPPPIINRASLQNISGISRSGSVLPSNAQLASSKTIFGGVNIPTVDTIPPPLINRTSIASPMINSAAPPMLNRTSTATPVVYRI